MSTSSAGTKGVIETGYQQSSMTQTKTILSCFQKSKICLSTPTKKTGLGMYGQDLEERLRTAMLYQLILCHV